MSRGIFGKKLGMTQFFDESGRAVPVTVVEVPPCRVLRVKSQEKDGYEAAVIAVGTRKKATRPFRGQTTALGLVAEKIRELRGMDPIPEVGAELALDQFQPGEKVDVMGITKGHGFTGAIKRWNFHRGPMAHGSKYHRGPGSLSPRMSGGGGKVFKGRKLPGHYGQERVTVQNLEVVHIDGDRRFILIKGAVPGPNGAFLRITDAIKERKKA